MSLQKKFQDKIVEPLQEFQEKIRQGWMKLKPRERLIVASLGGIMTVMLIALVGKFLIGAAISQGEMAEQNIKNIAIIQKLVDELDSQRPGLTQYGRLASRRSQDFKPIEFIKGEAQKNGINIGKINPTKAREESESAKEEWFEIVLDSQSSLESLLRFLESMDDTLGLRIVELTLKPQFADSQKFEATAIVASVTEL